MSEIINRITKRAMKRTTKRLLRRAILSFAIIGAALAILPKTVGAQ